MIKVNNVKLQLNYNENDLVNAIAKKLKIDKNCINSFSIIKKSLDARKKNDIKYIP